MAEDIRWLQRFSNLKKAFVQLEKADALPRYSELEQQGLIKGFEIVYELTWNTLRDYLEDQSYTGITGSKDTFRLAIKVGLIVDSPVWMAMVASRNMSSHTYNEDTADKIAEAIKASYVHNFDQLIQTLEAIRDERQGELFDNQ